ncbi:hypothetical protein OSB04_016508 [Centaurea solstitialis]|uniref:DUF4283 domain-containing protein n=1 Tax=Centaurea solstitialis TaxID=347529 RepID=A0AA38T139_9ASTR|nr:hypothetical protein OSB04_016508 [Centaurea solstitialis]
MKMHKRGEKKLDPKEIESKSKPETSKVIESGEGPSSKAAETMTEKDKAARTARKRELRKATWDLNWLKIKEILEEDRNALKEPLYRETGDTLLHIAVEMGHDDLVKKLLLFIQEKDVKDILEQLNGDGNTVLHVAVSVGNKHVMKLLVDKHADLLTVPDKNSKDPLIRAFNNMQYDTFVYLFKAAVHNKKTNGLDFTNNAKTGASLLVNAITAKQYSIALELIKIFPIFAVQNNEVLMAIARTFPNGLNYWETLIYPPTLKDRLGMGYWLFRSSVSWWMPWRKSLWTMRGHHHLVFRGKELIPTMSNAFDARLSWGFFRRSGFSGRRRWIVARFGGEGRLDLLFLPMVADQPPDPPVTRNRARKINAIKGTESSSLPASLPATTAAVPACGGTLDDRLAEGCTLVPQTNTIAAALSPDPPSPPLSAAPASSPVTTASPAVSSPPLVAAAEASAAPSGWFASRTSPATAGLSSPTMATTITIARPSISPTGTTGVFGDDVGPFQQLLRDVSGTQGFHQQSSMLSTADADNEHNLSDGKEPNAGSFVDSEGKVYLHADETDVAHKPVSFADLLKKSANLMCGKGKLTYYPPVVTELGTRRAIIPDDLVQKQANEWVLTLAGYFIGKRPAFPFVQYHARRMWKKYGLTDVILNDQGYFFFKFNSDQGLNFVFENGPWLFNGMPIFIQRWQPGLCFDKPDLQTVPLWVNIYGLPLDVWDYEIISRIASVVGEPVSVDRYTDEMCETKSGRANFARVLVNVSADYELPSYIDAIILGKLRKFKTEFLWKPKRCSHCKVFGHDFEGCVIRPRTSDEVKKVNHVVGESSTPKDDGFNFPKRKKKPKPTVDPLKVGPKVAGIKINQRYVPKVILPTTDPLDKGKTKLNNDIPSPKAPIFKTERTPMPVKVSNQFTVLEEHPKWTADKKEVDCYVEKRGVGLEPVIINSWSRQKLDYFIDRWERVFGKELDGKLRGFTLPDRIDVGDDDDDDTSDDDVLSDHDTLMDTRPKKVSWSDRQVSTKMEQDMQ